MYTYDDDGTQYRYYVPPPGLNPLTATDAQLDEYGLPPRPTDITAAAAWQTEMSNYHPGPSPPFLAEVPD